MDKAALFHQFIASDSVSDMDYSSKRFSFITVFYRSTYDYSFCTCGFEHEYLMYLSESGEVNEEMFEKLIQSIIDGKCPHVDQASKQQLLETSVNGVYIAAAKGNELVVRRHLDRFRASVGGIFKLMPLDIAILKGKYRIANMYYKHMSVDLSEPIHTVKIMDGVPVKILLETTTRIQMCLHTKDAELLKKASKCTHLSQALRKTYKQGLANELRIFSDFFKFQDFLVDTYIESAIIYNQPKALDRILKMTPDFKSTRGPILYKPVFELDDMPHPRPLRDSPNVSLFLSYSPLHVQNYLCNVLNRGACKRVLSDNGLLHHVDVSTGDQIGILISRLEEFYDDCKAEIIAALTKIPRDQRAMSFTLNQYLTMPHISNNLFETVISLGADVNLKNPIRRLFENGAPHNAVMVREKLGLFIYENPVLVLHERDVFCGIELDEKLQARQIEAYDVAGEYIADAQKHGLFGYDDEDTFALNFFGPILMECGFPADRCELRNLLVQFYEAPEKLHPAEVAYIQRYLETPRSLAYNCRDSLRNHFRGRMIHDFVEHIECPQKIKDFILITQISRPKIYKMKRQ